MRILQLAQFLPPVAGGEERHVWNLSRQLAARSHDVTLLGFATRAQECGTEHIDGVRVVRVRPSAARLSALYSDPGRPHALPLADPAVSRAIGRELASAPHDVVHAHNWIVNSAIRPASRAGVPVVLTLHDYSHLCATKRLMEQDRAPCPGASARRCLPCTSTHYGRLSGPVTAVANAWSARRRAYSLGAVAAVSSPVAAAATGRPRAGLEPQVIPNFIPDDIVLDDIPAVSPDAPFVFAGDLSRDKGIQVLLEAYAQLHPVHPSAPLLLAGRSPGGAPWQLPAGARWLGEIPHHEVLGLFRSARAVVVPSIWPDPCPTVVLEAMAAGRPVIAAASGGIVDMVLSGQTGLLVAPGDFSALAEAMSAVLSDPDAAAALGVAGRDRARLFTVSSVVGRIEQMYRRSIAHHSSPVRP
jgi:glycosyltransferase involved in cell wall biosynthesis